MSIGLNFKNPLCRARFVGTSTTDQCSRGKRCECVNESLFCVNESQRDRIFFAFLRQRFANASTDRFFASTNRNEIESFFSFLRQRIANVSTNRCMYVHSSTQPSRIDAFSLGPRVMCNLRLQKY
jgi:hypothetical protein